jgi:3-dehydroquinate synthase
MVDASIGGKNGVDVGVYKNLVGLIKQPDFLLFDLSLLQTLPQEEWINGFAEIIKHAAIKDIELFGFLEEHELSAFQSDQKELGKLIEKNVSIKSQVVLQDEFETGDRKLLNFGHTFGHAIENINHLPHGHAVSIGMVIAAKISEEINNFYSADKERLIALITKYMLPTEFKFDKERIKELLKMDKKREASGINFVLLNKIGEAVIKQISFGQLQDIIDQNL